MHSEEEAFALKNNISPFLKEHIFPSIEALFDQYDGNNQILRFENMQLNLNIEDFEDVSKLKNEICHQIEQKLQNQAAHVFRFEQSPANESTGYFSKEIVAPQLNLEQTFFFFIEHGYLPWFGKELYIEKFIEPDNYEQIIQKAGFLNKLKRLVIQNKNILDRLIFQFPNSFLTSILSSYNQKIDSKKQVINELYHKINSKSRDILYKVLFEIVLISETEKIETHLKLLVSELIIQSKSSTKKNELWEAISELIQEISHKSISIEKILQRIIKESIEIENSLGEEFFVEKKKLDVKHQKSDETENISARKEQEESLAQEILKKGNNEITEPNTSSKADISEVALNKTELTELFAEELPSIDTKEEKEVFFNNAGLIILHPFFKHFFMETSIADDEGNLPEKDISLAVQALHFLATGKENVMENNLVFEKFICGVPLSTPVQKQSLLSEDIKEEANSLLDDAIKKWPALKNTSPQGLRQLFLQREGKLIKQNKGHKLFVERKAQDILLDKLAWTISIVKLPWHSTILIVEWN